jgi:hypothetical protein
VTFVRRHRSQLAAAAAAATSAAAFVHTIPITEETAAESETSAT